jgi:hypothetical protein
MTRNQIAGALAAALLVFSTHTLGADVRADQKTRIQLGGVLGSMMNFFGGKGAREGVVSTVAVKGDRKLTTKEDTGQIIDLAEEKVYDLDLKKKSYKVTTFAELRRRMEDAQKKAAESAQKQEGGQAQAPASAPASNKDEKQMEVDVDIKNTGATKIINGFDTHQVITTITLREKGKKLEESGGMVVTTDSWLAPKIAAMKEIVDFDIRYAQKMSGGMIAGASPEQMAAAMALYPTMKQAMGRMTAEGAKIDGTAIMTTVTMDAVKSAEEIAKENTATTEEKPAPGLGGLLGALAKKNAAKKGDASNGRTTFMTSTNEVLKVATDVSAADVAVPVGFKENK